MGAGRESVRGGSGQRAAPGAVSQPVKAGGEFGWGVSGDEVAGEFAHVGDVGGHDRDTVGEVVGDGARALEGRLVAVGEDGGGAGAHERETLRRVAVLRDGNQLRGAAEPEWSVYGGS